MTPGPGMMFSGGNPASVDFAYTDVTTNNRLDAAYASNALFTFTGDVTFSWWMKLDALPVTGGDYLQVPFSSYEAEEHRYYCYLFQHTDDKYYVRFILSGDGANYGTYQWDVNSYVSASAWQHYCITWDVSDPLTASKLYLTDAGAESTFSVGLPAHSSGATPTSFYAGTADLRVSGFPVVDFYAGIDGKIDELSVFDYKLIKSEVDSIWKSVISPGDWSSCIGYWRMENNYNDSSGVGNHLTPTGSVSFSTDVPPVT